MLTLERDVEASFIRKLRKLGWRSAKLKAISNMGWPDRLIPLPNGITVFIEFKSPTGKGRLSAHQLDVIEHLTACGIPVLVTSSADEAIDFCKGWSSVQITRKVCPA